MHRGSALFEACCRVVETGEPFSRQALEVEDDHGGTPVRPCFDVRATKHGDGFVAVWRDVTPQKRIEEELHRTTEMLTAILDASPAAIWAKDREGRYLLTNRRGAANLGRRTEEILGKTDAEILKPEIAAALSANDRRVLATGRIEAFEEIIDLEDGPHTYLAVKFPLGDPGAPYAVGGVATDITDRKRVEAALRESEERARERAEELALILRSTPAVIWLAHDPACRRITGSRAAYEMLLVPEPGNLSKSAQGAEQLAHFRVLHNGEELSHEALPVQRAARGEELQGFEEEIVFDDGTRRYLYGNAVPLRDREGKPRGAIGAFIDVTELRLGEQERERLLADEQAARAAAEAASRAKDEFLATVSHELRTPLHAILGWTQLMLERGVPDETTMRAVRTIERNARLQAQLIEDILDASRIVAGRIRLDLRPVELTPLVEAVLESQRPAADGKSLRLSAALDPEAGTVLGDPSRLQQVVWNLVSNAIKFTPPGGEVDVALERRRGEARFRVRDTGVGIEPEFLPFVFEPFRQADPSASRRHGGLGLGLSIVRHLVELHGGAVEVESAGHGHGATFTLRLPVVAQAASGARADAEETRAAAEALDGLSGARVLVVDDEPDACSLLVKLLGDRGAVVRACASAAEALDAVGAWLPDVLVSDIGMPQHDGYWLIQRVRALPKARGGGTPALALTAYASVEDRVRALASGYNLHAPKPIDVGELLVAVAVLSRSRDKECESREKTQGREGREGPETR